MKKIAKIVLMWFLCCVCMVLISENDVFATECESSETVTFSGINPIYEEIISDDDLTPDEHCPMPLIDDPIYETDEHAVSENIRQGLINRASIIAVYYESSEKLTYTQAGAWAKERFAEALEETADPHAGDYIRYNYAGYSGSMSIISSGNTTRYCVYYYVKYYTTWEQEQEFDAKLQSVLTELGVKSGQKTDYEKIRLIYDYITSNVKYDFSNLNNDQYDLKYTAYAALVNKEAVCQGFATLLYRMLEECGIDTRVISGDAQGPHAWNIVRYQGLYYLMDATWDAGEEEYDYFLKGSDDFYNSHFPDEEFFTPTFVNAYPISTKDCSGENQSPTVELSSCSIELDPDNAVYDGTKKYPRISIYDGSYKLVEGVDYTVNTMTCINAGSYDVVVTGIGNYKGTVVKEFVIKKADQKVILSTSGKTLIVGESLQIDARGEGTITYKSEDTTVAIVNDQGKVTAKAPGKVNIIVEAKGTKNYNLASSKITITVVNNDPVEQFVTRLYKVCLNREPDESGKKDWINRLESGEITGSQAASGFIFSAEFRNKNLCNEDYVEQLYNAFMGRSSDAGGKAYWVKNLNSGMTREEVFNGFALSVEFSNLCEQYGILLGSGMEIPIYGTVSKGNCSVCGNEDGVTGFVKRLYSVCLDREADAGGLSYWTSQLWDHTNSGRGVAYGFVFSQEFINRDFDDADYVEYLYKAFMGRDSDAAGKADWVNRLATGWSREDVFDGFAGSMEFDNICKRYGILRD